MADRIALDSSALDAALRVLRREQSAYLPTKREAVLYRALNVSAFAILVAGALLLTSLAMQADSLQAIVNLPAADASANFVGRAGLLVAALSGCGMVVLFPFNLGLMRKLYRHAKLRRRLKLVNYFAPAFSAERRTSRLANVFTMAMFLLGLLLVACGVFVLIILLVLTFAQNVSLVEFLVILVPTLVVVVAGISFASVHFVRRGKHRLEVVQRLETSLEKQASDNTVRGTVESGATLSVSEYQTIAGMERQQIIRDRVTSIAVGRKEESAGYICQTSRQMYQSKSGLPPELLMKVEKTIAGLLVDPSAGGEANVEKSGSRTVSVANTSLTIRYGVDPKRQLIQLFELEGAAA